jgi:hypothetical protein
MNLQVERVALPRGIDAAGAARNVVFQLVDIAGDAPTRLLSAKLVREVDVDGALHGRKDEADGVAFQPAPGAND